MSDNKSLPAIVAEMSLILNQIVEAGGELSPELETAFDNLGSQIQTKADGYAFFMDRLDNEADYWKAKADQLIKVSRSCANLKERLNNSIKLAMRQLDTDEVKGTDMRFKLSKLAPKLVLEESALPAEYTMIVQTTKPDKDRIKADLENKVEIPGATLEPVYSLRKYPNRKN